MSRAVQQRRLMALLWAIGLLRVFLESSALAYAALFILALYVALSIPASGRINRAVAVLAGTLAVAVCALEGRWQALLDGLIFSLLFTAFLPTLQLIRTSLDVGSEVSRSRALFERMGDSQRTNAVVVGGHVLGSVMTLGALPMLAPLLADDARQAERVAFAQAVLRGLALAIFWSPFTVGMALALAFRPSLALWQAMGGGLLIAVSGTLLSVALFGRGGGWRGIAQALAGFRPLALPLGGAMSAVVVAATATPLGTLATIIVVMPLLCVAWVVAKNRRALWRVARTTYARLDRLGGELLLFCSAVTLGRVLQESAAFTGLLNQPLIAELPTAALIAALLFAGFGLAMAGLHSVVIGACVMAGLTPFEDRISDLVAVQVLLYGWSCGALLSLSALSVVVAASVFRVSIPHILYWRNVLFMFVLGALLWSLLAMLNSLG